MCVNCGRDVTAAHWYRTGRPRCWRRVWSKADDFRLMALWEQGKSDTAIAEAMGTSRAAVELHRKRIGVTRTTAHRAVMSGRDVGRRMGIGCEKTVSRWIRLGWLKATPGKGYGPRSCWNVTESSLRAFLADERYWVNWTPERLTDAILRDYSDTVRGDVRFLTLGQAADVFGVATSTVRGWINKGWIRGYRPGERGNHQVRSDEVARLAAGYVYGVGLKEAA